MAEKKEALAQVFRGFQATEQITCNSLQCPPSTRAARSAYKTWFSDPATYPIIGIMAFAGSMVTFEGIRYVTGSPDVAFNKEKRSQMDLRSEEDGAAFRSHRITAATLKANPITREAEYQEFKTRNL
ncbi:hypothetical protein H257_07897 [Aphanomyces astaci]|uniref:Uncharacterized protein n=1 Tax=Aphanomyces astaci TaxID=112090 RepID=W4GGA9_APHAT|nr:hypothetical protein H257_07897 [Aphanomyces astaci]ETV78311.1 hypothetical protein H257_07897 [Aphanomyces astaci]|eukprot:XP_009831892.1 hypothetical protein H257_07897 [Aphanomyces astaci]